MLHFNKSPKVMRAQATWMSSRRVIQAEGAAIVWKILDSVRGSQRLVTGDGRSEDHNS